MTQTKKDPNAVALGKKGGQKTKNTHPPDYYKEIGKKGGRPRKLQTNK